MENHGALEQVKSVNKMLLNTNVTLKNHIAVLEYRFLEQTQKLEESEEELSKLKAMFFKRDV